MPDITGYINAHFSHAGPGGEAFYLQEWGSANAQETALSEDGYTSAIIRFAASHSNAIYGASNTVQPPALALIPQIKF